MDEQTLKQLLFAQRPVPSQAFDQRIQQEAQRLVREETPMKKKMSVLAIAVAVLLSLTLFGAVAELLGLNLFELFGKDDQRLAQLAPKAVLDEISPITVTSPELGTTTAAIHSAYYDGESLIVAYAIQNGKHVEAYTPTQEALALMEKDDNPPEVVLTDPPSDGLLRQWNEAVQAGKPFGYVAYSITPRDSTVTSEGLDLPASSEGALTAEGGQVYSIREFESPLPEGARHLETLRIEIGLFKSIQYRYFDGQQVFTRGEYQRLEPMKATIWRADAQIKGFTGEGSFAGLPFTATVTASAASAQVTLALQQDSVFPLLPEDAWYSMYLRDENQAALRPQGGGMGGVSEMTIAFDGTGQLPQALELQLRVDAEEGVQLEPALVQPVFLTLKAAP